MKIGMTIVAMFIALFTGCAAGEVAQPDLLEVHGDVELSQEQWNALELSQEQWSAAEPGHEQWRALVERQPSWAQAEVPMNLSVESDCCTCHCQRPPF